MLFVSFNDNPSFQPPQSPIVSLKSGRNSYSRYYKMEHNKFYYKQLLGKISPFTFLRNGS